MRLIKSLLVLCVIICASARPTCQTDSDCANDSEFCATNNRDNTQMCKPFSQVNESCGGRFEVESKCDPALTCVRPQGIADAPGSCKECITCTNMVHECRTGCKTCKKTRQTCTACATAVCMDGDVTTGEPPRPAPCNAATVSGNCPVPSCLPPPDGCKPVATYSRSGDMCCSNPCNYEKEDGTKCEPDKCATVSLGVGCPKDLCSDGQGRRRIGDDCCACPCQDCTGSEFCAMSNLDNTRKCKPFSRVNQPCGGNVEVESKCAPALTCVHPQDAGIADVPGSCKECITCTKEVHACRTGCKTCEKTRQTCTACATAVCMDGDVTTGEPPRPAPCNAATVTDNCPVPSCLPPSHYEDGCKNVATYSRSGDNDKTCCSNPCNYEKENGTKCEPDKCAPVRLGVGCPKDLCSDGRGRRRIGEDCCACPPATCQTDSDCATESEFCAMSNLDNTRKCKPFSRVNQPCGGHTQVDSRCAPTLTCVHLQDTGVVDMPGRCEPDICAAVRLGVGCQKDLCPNGQGRRRIGDDCCACPPVVCPQYSCPEPTCRHHTIPIDADGCKGCPVCQDTYANEGEACGRESKCEVNLECREGVCEAKELDCRSPRACKEIKPRTPCDTTRFECESDGRQCMWRIHGNCSVVTDVCATVRCPSNHHCVVNVAGAASCKCGCEDTHHFIPRPHPGREICGTDQQVFMSECAFVNAQCKDPALRRLDCNVDCLRLQCKNGCTQNEMTGEASCDGERDLCRGDEAPQCNENSQCKHGQCVCTLCDSRERLHPICVMVGGVEKRFERKCELKQAICEGMSEYNRTECSKESCQARDCKFGAKCSQGSKCECPSECPADPRAQQPVCVTHEGGRRETMTRCAASQLFCRTQGASRQVAGPCQEACAAAKCRKELFQTCKDGECVCGESCSRLYQPLCGLDGLTYGNKCEYQNAVCKLGKSFALNHTGPCAADAPLQACRGERSFGTCSAGKGDGDGDGDNTASTNDGAKCPVGSACSPTGHCCRIPEPCQTGPAPKKQCLVAPCSVSKCKGHLDAVCETPCGTCDALFFSKGVDVTSQCAEAPPTICDKDRVRECKGGKLLRPLPELNCTLPACPTEDPVAHHRACEKYLKEGLVPQCSDDPRVQLNATLHVATLLDNHPGLESCDCIRALPECVLQPERECAAGEEMVRRRDGCFNCLAPLDCPARALSDTCMQKATETVRPFCSNGKRPVADECCQTCIVDPQEADQECTENDKQACLLEHQALIPPCDGPEEQQAKDSKTFEKHRCCRVQRCLRRLPEDDKAPNGSCEGKRVDERASKRPLCQRDQDLNDFKKDNRSCYPPCARRGAHQTLTTIAECAKQARECEEGEEPGEVEGLPCKTCRKPHVTPQECERERFSFEIQAGAALVRKLAGNQVAWNALLQEKIMRYYDANQEWTGRFGALDQLMSGLKFDTECKRDKCFVTCRFCVMPDSTESTDESTNKSATDSQATSGGRVIITTADRAKLLQMAIVSDATEYSVAKASLTAVVADGSNPSPANTDSDSDGVVVGVVVSLVVLAGLAALAVAHKRGMLTCLDKQAADKAYYAREASDLAMTNPARPSSSQQRGSESTV